MNHRLYVALGGENKVAVFRIDPDSGRLGLQQSVALDGDPGPLCADPDRRFLHVGLWSRPRICSFRIDRSGGDLAPIATIATDAYASCLNTDRRGRFLLSCSCGSGLVGVHAVGGDGAVDPRPVEWIRTMHGAHWIETDRANRHLFVSHVAHRPGSNAILQFLFDQETGRLTPNAVPRVEPPDGTGPRDYAFHPTRPIVYCANEQRSSVTAYRLDQATGTLEAFQAIATVPEWFIESSECSQIRVHPSGRFVYVANRGHNSIACFAVDAATGELTRIGVPFTGETPRAFHIDPAGDFLFVGGMGTGRILSYRIEREAGTLTALEPCEAGRNPMWLLCLDLDTGR